MPIAAYAPGTYSIFLEDKTGQHLHSNMYINKTHTNSSILKSGENARMD